ncbi:hypothetical protein G7046_g5443 [Stylonectria norvegica]|nr:hypothetical protein G7046_g5443 [Stylonectria norvegica]
MVYIPPEFEPARIPESEVYEGTEVDPNVRALLPEGCIIIRAATHGASFWAISHKITVELAEGGEEKSYFLKVFMIGNGEELVKGEFESTKAWHSLVPENIPKPIGIGECANRPGKHFLLLEFRDMSDDMPPASDFVAVVAKGHQAESPTGKFGFHEKTFTGNVPYDTRWCDTWEEFFTRIMKDTMKLELEAQGRDPELEQLSEQILSKVIPRLLRPMETEGRKIKPVLVHGDLWHGNVGIDNETDEPVLYDCGSFYGHNEYDFSMWRAARYRTNKPHIRAYWRIAEMTEPVEDEDDRIALYAARNDLNTSICWHKNKRMRQLAIEEFRRLVALYHDGYEGYAAGLANRNAFSANQAVMPDVGGTPQVQEAPSEKPANESEFQESEAQDSEIQESRVQV